MYLKCTNNALIALAAAFRSLLPSHYDFVFIDGQGTCDPAPGVADVYSGPYLCWYSTPTTSKVAAAHQTISSVVEKQGPFDAVMGFSQVGKHCNLTRSVPCRSGLSHRGHRPRSIRPNGHTFVPSQHPSIWYVLSATSTNSRSSGSSSCRLNDTSPSA